VGARDAPHRTEPLRDGSRRGFTFRAGRAPRGYFAGFGAGHTTSTTMDAPFQIRA